MNNVPNQVSNLLEGDNSSPLLLLLTLCVCVCVCVCDVGRTGMKGKRRGAYLAGMLDLQKKKKKRNSICSCFYLSGKNMILPSA